MTDTLAETPLLTTQEKRSVRIRWFLVGFLILGGVVNYLDRSTLSVANTTIAGEFGLNAFEMGLLLSAFSWPYAIANLPAGYLVDKFGPKRMFAFAAGAWSLVSMVTAAANSFGVLYALRVALGITESPFFTSALKVNERWFNKRERALPVALVNTGSQIANAIAPPLLTFLLLTRSWRGMFVIVGALGIVVALVWLRIYRDPTLSEQALIKGAQAQEAIASTAPKVGWGRLLQQRNTWFMVLGAFGFQALGALTGTAVGYLILTSDPEIGAWRWMYATAIIPAAIVLIGRFFITESAPWLASRGRVEEAQREMTRLLAREPLYPKAIHLKLARHEGAGTEREAGYRAFLQPKSARALVLASVPWFLQDLGTYGIGIFTPTILAASLGHVSDHHHSITELVAKDVLAAKGAALIDVLLIIGIVCAIFLADRAGRIPLQIIGFLGCAAGLMLAAFSIDYTGSAGTLLLFAGFMLFNFMTNLGPNAQTYLIAGEVFPTAVRGTGAGLAAAFAKIGAVLTAFLFPILLADIGTKPLLYILVATSLLGAAVTWIFRIETTGRDLDALHE